MKNTICGIVKNEAPYLLEWIAYHKAIGIDAFVIYDNLSTDNSYDILRALDRAGIIKTYSQHENDGGSPQLKAYNHCIRNHGADTELMTFIDADEFMTPADGVDLKAHITQTFAAHPDMSAMGINWMVFGSSGETVKRPGFLIERFQYRDANPSSVIKTIVKPQAVKEMFIHYAELKAGRYGDELGRPVTFREAPGGAPGSIATASASKVQLNHYMVKSREEFAIKRSRGNANYTQDHPEKYKRFTDAYFHQFDLNHKRDASALRYLDETRRIHDALQQIVGRHD